MYHLGTQASVVYHDDKPHAVLGIARDITDRKHVEEALKESSGRYKELSTLLESLFNAIPDVLGVQDKQHGIIRYNQAGYDFLGRTQQGVEGKKCFELINRTKPCDICATSEVYKTKKPARVEKYIEDMGIWLDCRSYPVFDEKGNITKIIEHLRDITEHKLAENALKESEDRFSRAIAGTSAGLWDWDIVNDRVYFSPQWKTMLGYEDHEVEDDFSGWKNLWHPEDAARIEKAVNDYLQGRASVYEVEHRLRHKDGSRHWILTRGDIHRDAAGRPVRWVGTNIDITERKRPDEARFDALARFSGFADASQYGMGMADLDGHITFANATLARMLGEKTSEDLFGKAFPDCDITHHR